MAAAAFPPSGEELLQMIRILPDVLFRCVKRDDGKIVWTFNEGRLAQEFHVTTREIEGKTLEDLFPGGASDALARHFEEAFAGRPRPFVNEIDGRHFRHDPQPVYGPDGKVEALVGFITEVTETVQAREVIQDLNAQMMARVVELNEANDRLRQANENLEKTNQDLDAFAFTVSHDLRGPLTVIENLTYAMGMKYEEALGLEGTKRLHKIRAATRRMDTLIADILRFSRANRTPVERREVDLSAEARRIVDDLRQQEPEREMDLDVADGLRAEGDVGLLRVALENLLGNAWKYSGGTQGARIRVYAQTLEDGGQRAFVVEDNGIGFTPAEAERVFDAFHRLEGAKGFAGTGIGLATVRRIIDRHGGRVWAEGRPGEGARFLFTLPPATA